MTPDPSDERLNALIDGELTPADAEALLEQLRVDPALRERVAQLELGQHLVRHAYARLPPAPKSVVPIRTSRPWPMAVAASLTAGLWLGWVAHDPPAALREAAMPPDSLAAQARHIEAQHVLLHVSTASPQSGQAALDRAEGLLATARQTGRPVSVEIVAHSEGLDLLRMGTSAHGARIARLRATYPSLALVACGQTAQRLRDAGTPVRLLDGTREATSALDEIVLRMQQGWTYVRI